MKGIEEKGKNYPKFRILSFAVVIVVVIILTTLFIWSVNRLGSSQNEMKKLLEQGQNGFLDMDYEEAVSIFDVYLKKEPQNEEVRNKIEKTFLVWTEREEKSGNLNRALEIATKGYEMLQSDPLKNEMGRLEGIAKQSAGSVSQVSGADESDAADVAKDEHASESEDELSEQDKLRLLFEEHLRTDNPEDAVNFYQSQAEGNPSETVVYEFGAAVYLLQDDVIQALSILETGISNGADKTILEEKESDIRENTVILSSDGITKETDYDGYVINGWEKISYDEKGNEIKRESSNGTTTQYEYDSEGNLTTYSYQHPSGKDRYQYKYNAHGDRIYMKYESEYMGSSSVSEYAYEYEYNDKGWALHRTESRDGLLSGTEEYYEYDEKGNRIRVKYVSGGILQYEDVYSYDDAGRVLSYESVGNIIQPTCASYEYDERGNVVVANEWHGSTYTAYDLMDYPLKVSYSGVVDDGVTYTNIYHFSGDAYRLLKNE